MTNRIATLYVDLLALGQRSQQITQQAQAVQQAMIETRGALKEAALGAGLEFAALDEAVKANADGLGDAVQAEIEKRQAQAPKNQVKQAARKAARRKTKPAERIEL